ncbi:Cro/CI family transcriptional regulator [Psychromonas aquimarina]|uniref:Cro/CI family transcriptional regulator n=1 Tax=Psychromonas aquimarina TaxID=444919 RepID=UPI0003F85C5E|nr:Cro/CI family transcriptional regulator [Psychromonas aquimarina]
MKKIDVINFFGTQEKTARALGVKQASVSRWPKEVPQRRAFEIERITNGALKADFVVPQQATIKD